MNTEEKARAYDEVRKKIALRFGSNVAEKIFSEFEMSEDEKVRKELINVFSNREKYLIDKSFGDITVSEVLAWLEKQCYTKKDVDDAYLKGICNTKHELEKQGDQKSVDKEYTFKSIPRLLDMIEPTDRSKSYCKKLIDSLQTEGYSIDAKIVGECLKQMNGEKVAMAVMDNEKQGEQKFEMKTAEESLGIDSGTWNKIVDECVYGEKPADKVEPKFKVGDWITDGYLHNKITDVLEDRYIVDTKFAKRSSIPFKFENYYHLWTIQDAKDGDVLADDDNNIFIFDGTVEEGKYPFAYCGLTAQGFDSYDIRLPFTHDNNIHPATWEQRNLLFKKMKEAGYEWDDEKKELNKIEQKSQRMVSAEAKEALYDEPTDEEMKELLRTEYEKGRADTLSEMKSSWSEEDEKMLDGIVNTVKDVRCQSLLSEIEIYDDYIDWLESIKQRIGG